MTRRRDIARPYPPDYCDAETLAYRLDIARDDIGRHVKQGLLPPPVDILPGKRHWRWADVEAWIAARNRPADAAGAATGGTVETAPDPFVEGNARVARQGTKSGPPAHA